MSSTAIVGGGCFWCISALLLRLKGVLKVQSGYAGGESINPTYKDVCSGKTNHTEVCKIYYNPSIIPYSSIFFLTKALIYIFMHIHDPTKITKPQYRSVIFYQQNSKLLQAKKVLQQIKGQGKYMGYPAKIITEIKQIKSFYIAQENHQNYFQKNGNETYCQTIVKPKLSKLKQIFQKYVDNNKI